MYLPKKCWIPSGWKVFVKKCYIYIEKVERNTTNETYIGLCSTTFKARLGVHKQSIKNENINQTSLSKYIHKLKKEGKEYNLSWKIIDRGKQFDPSSGICQLCIKETYNIIFNSDLSTLNNRNELFSSCRHRKQALLCTN